VAKAVTDHNLAVANGSTDPTFGVDFGRNPPITIYAGVEKARTEIDIFYTQRQKDAADVSSHGWLFGDGHAHPGLHVVCLSARPGCAARV